MKQSTPRDVLVRGVWQENPVLVTALGLCPTLAVTKSVANSLAMGVATFFVLLGSSILVSSVRKWVPGEVRISTYILIIAHSSPCPTWPWPRWCPTAEHQTPDGEAQRDDERFAYAAAWEYGGTRPARAAQGRPEVRIRSPHAAELQVNLTLRIWRQKGPEDKGRMVPYKVDDVSPDMSFLEMLDVLNERLILQGEEPIAFDHDCREGICGMCGLMINGNAHGPQRGTTACQLHMRQFSDGETIDIEPWRAKAFQVVKDLIVDRGALDRIIAAGGFVSVQTGSAPWMPAPTSVKSFLT